MSLLWAVDCHGKVYRLSTADEHWTELEYCGLEIKKISVHEFFTWAIGGDHQIYIYVPARDIPIRYKVVTFENEVNLIHFTLISESLSYFRLLIKLILSLISHIIDSLFMKRNFFD